MYKAEWYVERKRLIIFYHRARVTNQQDIKGLESREKEEEEWEGKLLSYKHLLCTKKFGHASPVLPVIYSEVLSSEFYEHSTALSIKIPSFLLKSAKTVTVP